MPDRKTHWENVFATKAENEMSWFQPDPKTSIHLFTQLQLPLDANIIDIGAGDSHLIDAFIERGYKNIYALDISENALNRAKQRLGDKGKFVHWIVSDILEFKSNVKFDFWHDRAAFHFLTTEEGIEQYRNLTEALIPQGGHLVLGTFSENGPNKCSGLEIKQYSETLMSKCFEKAFQKIHCQNEDHPTPFNTFQNFLFCCFQKK